MPAGHSLGIASYGNALAPGASHGLKVVAVAAVAQAVWGMARTLYPDTCQLLFELHLRFGYSVFN